MEVDDSTVAASSSTGLFVFNLLLTVGTLTALVLEWLPLPLVFMTSFAVALVVNHPDPQAQRDLLTRHGSPAMLMVALILAAGSSPGSFASRGCSPLSVRRSSPPCRTRS